MDALNHIFHFNNEDKKMCLKNLKIADSKHPQSKTTVIHVLVIHFLPILEV